MPADDGLEDEKLVFKVLIYKLMISINKPLPSFCEEVAFIWKNFLAKRSNTDMTILLRIATQMSTFAICLELCSNQLSLELHEYKEASRKLHGFTINHRKPN